MSIVIIISPSRASRGQELSRSLSRQAQELYGKASVVYISKIAPFDADKINRDGDDKRRPVDTGVWPTIIRSRVRYMMQILTCASLPAREAALRVGRCGQTAGYRPVVDGCEV